MAEETPPRPAGVPEEGQAPGSAAGAPDSAGDIPRGERKGDSQARTVSRRRRRLSEEERKALWHKAVMAKARKLKIISDVATFVCLACIAGAMFLPLVGGMRLKGAPGVIRQRTGLELVIGLLKPSQAEGAILGTHPYIEKDDRGIPVELVDEEPADVFALGFLLVPFGAALLFVLYLVDYKLFMGRLLPALAMLYGFGMTAYLMLTKTPSRGVWNALGLPSQSLGWYMLLVPLFLLGVVSALRFVVSQRWKRYEFAGLPVPEHLRPKEKPAEDARGRTETEKGEA